MPNRVIVTVISIILLVCMSAGAQEQTWNTASFVLSHPDGHPQIDSYACANFSQEITERCVHALDITVKIAHKLPQFPDAYPVVNVPEEIQPYLAASPRIQSKNQEVMDLATRILSGVPPPRREVDVVAAVIEWTSKNMVHAYPNEVPDAVTCIKRRKGNCIGFTHAAAALLRNLGIPVRTVRTLHACPTCGGGPPLPDAEIQAYKAGGLRDILYPGPATGFTHMLRHSIIEVYYPESKKWAMYDPQVAAVPTRLNIVLGQDVDWNSEIQRKANAISKDKKTGLKILAPGEPGGHDH